MSLTVQKTPPRAPPAAALPHAMAHTGIREFLAFKIGAEEYGIDILKVQEIRSHEAPTRLASAPDFLLGVVNLRGVIVPIVDMRVQFGLPDVAYNDFTVVIVLNLSDRVVGIVVDGVSDVITLAPDQLRAAPAFGDAVPSDHLLAIGAVDDRMLILVDIERMMGSIGFARLLPGGDAASPTPL